MAALALVWGGGPAPAAAHSPHPGLDFSIGVDVDGDTDDDCGTKVGQPTKCSVPAGSTFQLKVYLNSLGSIPDYGGFDIYVEYAGVSSKNNPDANPWPDCVFEASDFQPGFVYWGCAKGVPPGPQSTYTGLIGTNDFNCGNGGSVTLVHGFLGWTDLVESVPAPLIVDVHAEGDKTRETLTINCTETPTPTPIPPPAVGGISLDPAARALAAQSAEAPGPDSAFLAAIATGATAGSLALAGAAWYARRRWLRS